MAMICQDGTMGEIWAWDLMTDLLAMGRRDPGSHPSNGIEASPPRFPQSYPRNLWITAFC